MTVTILDTIKRLHEMGFWLEIVTLVIPGFNETPTTSSLGWPSFWRACPRIFLGM